MTRVKSKKPKHKTPTKVKRKLKPTPKTISKPTPPDTTLRNMLMMRTGMLPAGYSSQQYGNINNERNINNLQNSNQIIAQRIAHDSQTISMLESENKKLKKEAKEKKHEKERLENEHAKNEEELSEAARVEGAMDVLNIKIRNDKQKLSELKADNEISNLKIQYSQLADALEQEKYKNIALKQQVDSNAMYLELSKLKRERDKIVAENKDMQASIESPEFQNPSADHIKSMQEYQKAVYEQQLLQKQASLQQENYNYKVQKEAILKENNYKVINDKYEKAIQDQLLEQTKLKDDIYNAQAPIRTYNIQQQNLQDLQKENSKLRIEQQAAQRHSTQLLQQNNYGIGDTITKEAQEKGRLRGDLKKTQEAIKRRSEIREFTIREEEAKAEADELNKPISSAENEEIKKKVEKKISAEQEEQKVKHSKDFLESQREKNAAKYEYDILNTDDYIKGEKEITEKLLATKEYEMQTAQYKTLSEAEKHRKKAARDRRVAQKIGLGTNDAAHIQQITAIDEQIEDLSKRRENLLNIARADSEEKDSILERLRDTEKIQIQENRRATLKRFFSENPQYNVVDENFDIIPVDVLRKVPEHYRTWNPREDWSDEEEEISWGFSKNKNNNY